MKQGARESIPLVRARQIVSELQIKEPDEIDITAISFHYKVPVQSKFLRGMDGQLVRRGDRALITVSSSLQYEPQKRFVIAHELGHYFLHPKARQFDEVRSEQSINWSETQQKEEYEANHFAAELLMPKVLLDPLLPGTTPSFDLIQNLAKAFNTSLTSAAVRFVQSTPEECVLVLSKNRQRQWFIPSPGFSFMLHEDGKVHGHSCAASVGPTKKRDRCEAIEAGFWLRNFYGDRKSTIVEDARYSTQYGSVLSLIWINEAI